MYVPHFKKSSNNGHLASFYFLVIVRNAAVNIHVDIGVWTFLWGAYPGVKPLSHMATVWFKLWRSCKVLFQRNTVSHFPPQCRSVPVAVHPQQRLSLSDFGHPGGCEGLSSLPFSFARPR